MNVRRAIIPASTTQDAEETGDLTALLGRRSYGLFELQKRILDRLTHERALAGTLPVERTFQRNQSRSSPELENQATFDEFEFPRDLADRLSVKPPPVVSFYAIQEWDGYVLSVHKDTFRARLTDLSQDGDAEDFEADIPLEELDDRSRDILEANRLFRWSVGFERLRTGQKKRVSKIIIRDLPAWTRKNLDDARFSARLLLEKVKWDDGID